MNPRLAKVLFWTPRIITILFALFLMIFSLDVFGEGKSAGEIALGLLMHNLPSIGILLLLWITWKFEWVGGVIFPALGLFYIFWSGTKFGYLAWALIGGPPILLGALFLIGWFYRKDIHPSRAPVAGLLVALLAAGSLSGCASFRSELHGSFQGEVKRNPNPKPVSVLFVFSHIRQTIGFDAVPKLQPKRAALNGFDDVLSDALRDLSNVGKYATFTEDAEDVNQPERRHKKDSLMTVSDYTVKIRIEATKRFSQHFLGTLLSTVSATLLPVPYTWTYTLKAEVLDRDRNLVATYRREARLTKWVEALLIVVYPFYPEERKREDIYMDFLHDLFRQMEAEGVLKAAEADGR